MFEHGYYLFKLMRPRQWIKNFALFAAVTFGGQLFNIPLLISVCWGAISFSFLSSATYIVNDFLDVKKDRLHPFKRGRPLASGKVSTPEAMVLFIVLLVTSLFIAIGLGELFVAIVLVYIFWQILYSFIFKQLVIFDILFIATGYILRVIAGEVVSGYHISAWLLLSTISLSLFLAVGKRRSELSLLRNYKEAKIEEVRKSLSHYSEKLLDAYLAMFATSTFILYSMFTFLENPKGIKITLETLLPDFLPYYLQRKWLMITIVPVIYGLMRYMQDIYEKSEGESPDRVLLSDKSFLVSVIVWVISVIVIIYFIS